MSLEVSDIFRAVFRAPSKVSQLSADKSRVVGAILSCRTAAAGVHIRSCGDCGHQGLAYNSCANRHCPQCQGRHSARWVDQRCRELLDVAYFHLVFTLPSELRTLCYQNKRLLYDAILKCSSETIQDAVRTRFEAQSGSFAVLHTWNQELMYHPHAHHVVPACGFLQKDSKPFMFPNTEKFFISTKVLSRLFRGKFLARLKEFYNEGRLFLSGATQRLRNPHEFNQLLSRCYRIEWVVYAKRPFAGPQTVVKYLASYIHRVGISSRRLLSFENSQVKFLARCHTNRAKKRPRTLSEQEFCRRFLMHILPKGFKRVRYSGFLRNGSCRQAVDLLQAHLQNTMKIPESSHTLSKHVRACCPRCSSNNISFQRIIKTHISQAYSYQALAPPPRRLH